MATGRNLPKTSRLQSEKAPTTSPRLKLESLLFSHPPARVVGVRYGFRAYLVR